MKNLLILITTITMLSCSNQNNSKIEKKMKQKTGTIELVIFKTKPEFSHKEVIEAANAVNPVVEVFDGYIGRKLAVSTDGTWTDIVYWTDLESAEHAAQEVMKSETCQKFFGMIDEESMTFMHLNPVIDTEK
ncbi:antibiotic biosynthesis monooxygenase family protein [Muriicola sp. Z0-33]|uniref:antibiotic biosynthesis monooxygenase family protein n=1 Tax=Muriicola sp. Z0-33 TaxID=2816957 RepID=UPI0022382436|nr:hypothetical protein [Muriicola sp. Z0-33]MCW5518121.1 hypothetical protein [Muriicola sp. Z0-33]